MPAASAGDGRTTANVATVSVNRPSTAPTKRVVERPLTRVVSRIGASLVAEIRGELSGRSIVGGGERAADLVFAEDRLGDEARGRSTVRRLLIASNLKTIPHDQDVEAYAADERLTRDVSPGEIKSAASLSGWTSSVRR